MSGFSSCDDDSDKDPTYESEPSSEGSIVPEKRRKLLKNLKTTQKTNLTEAALTCESPSSDANDLPCFPRKESKSKLDELFKFKVIDNRIKEATCRRCIGRVVYKVKDGNTTTLKRHLVNKHPNEIIDVYGSVAGTSKPSGSGGIQHFLIKQTTAGHVQPARSLNNSYAFADFIAEKYLPYNFFEGESSKKFFTHIQPGLTLPSRKVLKNMVTERFSKVRVLVTEFLKTNQSKISFTIDGWTCINGRSYYGITGHFIDSQCNMQSLVVDFVPSHGKHTGKDIAKIFVDTVKELELENKIMGITVDNASANTNFMLELSNILPNFDNENQHFRCIAHVLNLAVQDLLKRLNLHISPQKNENKYKLETYSEPDSSADDEEEVTTPLTKIRSLAKKISKSEQLHDRFVSACHAVKIFSPTKIPIDVPTRWNSTHDMMEAAVKHKQGIICLCLGDLTLSSFVLNEDEWHLVQSVTKFLKMFKKLSTLLGGEAYVTLPSVVLGVNLLLDRIEMKAKLLDEKPNRNQVDEMLILSYQAARDKILKHYKKTNWVYGAVLILDPRHRLQTFEKTKWGKELQLGALKKIEEIFHNYEMEHIQNVQVSISSSDIAEEEEDDDEFNINAIFKSQKNTTMKKELQEYLEEPLSDCSAEILSFWKHNASRYPTLFRIAKDLLSIPATSVPAERLFSSAGHVITKDRNRLSADSARHLLALHNWLPKLNMLNLY